MKLFNGLDGIGEIEMQTLSLTETALLNSQLMYSRS